MCGYFKGVIVVVVKSLVMGSEPLNIISFAIKDR